MTKDFQTYWQPFEDKICWPADGSAPLTKSLLQAVCEAFYDNGYNDGRTAERESWNGSLKRLGAIPV